MTLLAGTDVEISDAEVVTGSGLKREIYNAEVAITTLPVLYYEGQTTSPFSSGYPATAAAIAEMNPMMQGLRLTILRGIAKRSNVIGQTVIDHFTTNGHAVVGTSDSCGRYQGVSISGPASDLELDIQ